MKSIIDFLVFDKEIVEKTKASTLRKEVLYTQLISGKITLPEFLEMTK